MTTEEMIIELEKQGFEVRKKDLDKSEAIEFAREIKREWSRDWDILMFTPMVGSLSDWNKMGEIIRSLARAKGYTSYKSIPKDKREEFKKYIIKEGKKIILQRYSKKTEP